MKKNMDVSRELGSIQFGIDELDEVNILEGLHTPSPSRSLDFGSLEPNMPNVTNTSSPPLSLFILFPPFFCRHLKCLPSEVRTLNTLTCLLSQEDQQHGGAEAEVESSVTESGESQNKEADAEAEAEPTKNPVSDTDDHCMGIIYIWV